MFITILIIVEHVKLRDTRDVKQTTRDCLDSVVVLTITALMNAVILQEYAKKFKLHQLLVIPVASTRDVNLTIRDNMKTA